MFVNKLDDNKRQTGYLQQDGVTAHTTHDNLNLLI